MILEKYFLQLYHFYHVFHTKMVKIVAIRNVLSAKNSPECVCRRGFDLPGPRWGAYDAPPDPVVGWGREYSLPIHNPRTLSASLDGAFGVTLCPGTNYEKSAPMV